jgi:exopolyphosphatase/guanosine-5'-triphosphate,3'-diphosphate pyrophosphatase
VSLDIGAVRFTERFVHTDPPTRDEIDACARAVRALLDELDVAPQRAIGVAGTVTTLAALDLGLDAYDR